MGDPMNDFFESLRGLSSLAVPAVPEIEKVLASYRRNMEAVTAASKVALEGAQTAARRQFELAQQQVVQLGETMKRLAETTAAPAPAAQQTEILKAAYEKAIAHLQDLMEVIRSANTEALAVLNTRFNEAMEETRALMKPKENDPK